MRAREVNRIIEAKGGQHARRRITQALPRRCWRRHGKHRSSPTSRPHPYRHTPQDRKRPCPSTWKEMALVSVYEVIVTREGSSWLADIPAVPGAHTFARSLTGLA